MLCNSEAEPGRDMVRRGVGRSFTACIVRVTFCNMHSATALMMSHPLVLALYDDVAATAKAARALREMGIPRERLSIVARSHDEAGTLADAVDASPGSEIEDSRPAAVLGELSEHFEAAMPVLMPCIAPFVVDGPRAVEIVEAARLPAAG